MNVQANSRASSATRIAHGIPMLTASALCGGDVQVRALLLHASYPNDAPVIVAELESKARFNRLDRTLNEVLTVAKATVARSASYKAPRMH